MDDVITLVSESVINHDDYGNEIITTESREVFCKTYGVDRSEYYSASTVGLKPEVTVRLSDYADYQGEKIAVMHDVQYDIIRTYTGDNLALNEIELVLQRKIANG